MIIVALLTFLEMNGESLANLSWSVNDGCSPPPSQLIHRTNQNENPEPPNSVLALF